MAVRAKNFSKPHVHTTVEKFVQGITDRKVCRVTLGFPLPQYSVPFPFE